MDTGDETGRRQLAEAAIRGILALGYQISSPEPGGGGETLALAAATQRLAEVPGSMPVLRDLWSTRDEWGMDLATVQKLSGMALELGELGLVYEIGGVGLELDPGNPRLAQQVALAHVHDGHHDRAREVIAPIAAAQRLANLGPTERGEVLAVIGRIHKEIFRQTRDQADLDEACEAYRRAFDEGDGGSYPRINEASLRLIGGQDDEARRLAEEVIALVGDAADAWGHATRAEALLVLEDLPAACESYRMALAEHPSWRAGARMREQALWLIDSVAVRQGRALEDGARERLLEAFAGLPSIVVYGGSMFSDEDFPFGGAPVVMGRLAAALRRLHPAVLYGSAKCGADLMILEAAGGEVERQIFLPGPEREFIAAAVSPGGESWLQRFQIEGARPSSELLEICRHDPGGHRVAQTYVQEVMIGLARLRARRLGLDTRALVLWDPSSGTGGADTANLVQRCQATGIPVEFVSPCAGGRSAPAALARIPGEPPRVGKRARTGEQVIKAMLFADVEGFSALAEEQIIPFQNEYMRVVSSIIDEGGAAGRRQHLGRCDLHGLRSGARCGALRLADEREALIVRPPPGRPSR